MVVTVSSVDEHEDPGARVVFADAEVVEFPGVAEGEFAIFVDSVVTDPVEPVARGEGRRFRCCPVCLIGVAFPLARWGRCSL